MKRIYENIPLQSILYVVPGNTFITVKDMKASDVHFNRNANPIDTWQGLAKESYFIPDKYKYSKVYCMETEESRLTFYISTQFEKY